MAAKVVPGLTTNQRLDILDEYRPIKQQPGDVTVKMATEDWVVSKSKARDILEKAVSNGALIKLTVVVQATGRIGNVYRRINKKDI